MVIRTRATAPRVMPTMMPVFRREPLALAVVCVFVGITDALEGLIEVLAVVEVHVVKVVGDGRTSSCVVGDDETSACVEVDTASVLCEVVPSAESSTERAFVVDGGEDKSSASSMSASAFLTVVVTARLLNTASSTDPSMASRALSKSFCKSLGFGKL